MFDEIAGQERFFIMPISHTFTDLLGSEFLNSKWVIVSVEGKMEKLREHPPIIIENFRTSQNLWKPNPISLLLIEEEKNDGS